MAHYPDFTHLEDYGEGSFEAIGWRSREQFPYTPLIPGEYWTQVFEKLCELSINAWSPAPPGGVHHCEFCYFTGGSGIGSYKGYAVSGASAKELFIPGNKVIYVAPVGILHYMDAHSYMPPKQFCEAVLHCPAMRSSVYFKALLDNGARELVRGIPHHE